MKRAAWLQALASALMLLPLLFLNRDAFIGNTDALFYTTVLRLISDHIMMGDVQPLWLPEANGGTGSPLMLYYSPLAYQLTALIGLPIASIDPIGWKRLVLGMFAAQWFAGIATFSWMRRHATEGVALAASLLFTIFPYKLVYIFLHINLAQLWALVWLPLLMKAADDLTADKPHATGRYALWTALLILTHPRTLVAFAAVPALYVYFFAHHQRIQVICRVIAANLLALALTAFYLLPALLNLDLVNAAASNAGRMFYADNLSHKDMMLNFHYAIIAALVVGLLSRVPQLRRNKQGREAWFYLGVLLVTALLCLKISRPLWDALPILQFLQFPAARFHAVALIAATALSAVLLQNLNKVRDLRLIYSPPMLILPVLVMGVLILNYVGDVYQKAENITPKYIELMHSLNPILPPEYLTKGQPLAANMPEMMMRYAKMPLLSGIAGGKADVIARFEDSRTIEINTEISGEMATLKLRQLYLPQWKTEFAQFHSDEDGLMTFDIEGGEAHFYAVLTQFDGETTGRIVTLVACIILLMLLQPRARKQFFYHKR